MECPKLARWRPRAPTGNWHRKTKREAILLAVTAFRRELACVDPARLWSLFVD